MTGVKKKSSDFGELTENNSGLSWLHFSSFCQGTISEENQGLSYISTHWFIVILLGPWLEHLIPRSSLLLAKDPGLDKALQFSYQRTFRRGSAALQRAFKVSNGPPPARHLFFLMAQRPMQCQNHHLHLLLSSDINSIHVKKENEKPGCLRIYSSCVLKQTLFWVLFFGLHPVSSFPTIFWQYKDDKDVSLKGHLSSFNI